MSSTSRATKINIVIEQNADFSQDFAYVDSSGNPLSISGVSFSGAIRKHHLSANSFPFVITANNGVLNASLNNSITGYIDAGRHVYDLVSNDGSTIVRLYEGIATVKPGVVLNVGNNAVFSNSTVIVDDGTF